MARGPSQSAGPPLLSQMSLIPESLLFERNSLLPRNNSLFAF